MTDPDAVLAPVTPPVIVPMVQAKVLGAEAVKLIPGAVPLQILIVGVFVMSILGLTVTVIVYGMPEHKPTVAVGVTIYSTVPAVELLGLSSTWLMDDPDPALAPVTPPVMAPIVQLKVLEAEAVKLILVEVPLQILIVGAFVTIILGLTVTVTV